MLASLQQHLCQVSEIFDSILQSFMVWLKGTVTEGIPKRACSNVIWNVNGLSLTPCAFEQFGS